MVRWKLWFLWQEMAQAGRAHVVNPTVLQPTKISSDFTSVIPAPRVLCHPGNRKNLESTLWISSDHRVLGCCELLWSRLRLGQGTGCWFSADFRGNLEMPKVSETFGSELLCRGPRAQHTWNRGFLGCSTCSVL